MKRRFHSSPATIVLSIAAIAISPSHAILIQTPLIVADRAGNLHVPDNRKRERAF